LDVPSTSYISSVCESPEFVTYQTNNKDTQPRVIIHMIGNGVLEDERYQEWMKKFGPETEVGVIYIKLYSYIKISCIISFT
jgi:ribonuclease Z